MDGFKSGSVHVGVDLRRGNIRMAEHHLDSPKVGAAGEKMSGKRMPEHVRTDLVFDTCCPRPFFDDLPESSPAHAASSIRDKQCR